MMRRPPRSTRVRSSAASDVYKRQDPGLGGFLASVPDYAQYADANLGKHKVPTLRNVDKRPYLGFVKAYGHNGYFKSLKEIVHFYNTRDVPGAGWNGVPLSLIHI